MADLQKIVDDLSELSVLEAADLSKMLKEKWSGAGSGSRPRNTLDFPRFGVAGSGLGPFDAALEHPKWAAPLWV
jgi:hypothetical protein